MSDAKIIDWRERALAAEAREQALAAHVERLTALLDELPDVMPVTPHLPMAKIKGDYLERVDKAALGGPATSLARLIAEKQAEVLGEAAMRVRTNQIRPYTNIENMIQGLADELRRQAEQADTAGEA